MIDPSKEWGYKVRISERLVKKSTDPDSMAEEHLETFAKMSREELDRVFCTQVSKAVTNVVQGNRRTFGPDGKLIKID